jgi:DNA-binding transcriptional LysR family regulator
MNLSDVYVFKKVAATLSFTRAARQIGSSRSAVSKKISRLEQDLGVILVNRSTRRVNLTEAGRIFHQHTSEVDTKIEHAADIVRGTDLEPNGTVAFSIPSSLGAALMPALITQFQTTWPDLKFSIHFDDGSVDMIAASLDLAIRIARKMDDSSLISRRLATTHKVLAASPGYLHKYGTPKVISDLQEHRLLGLGSAIQAGTTWRFRRQEKIVEAPCRYSITANNNLALILAACLNNGIVYLPLACISNEIEQQRLQVILPDLSDPEPYGIFALYPHRKAAAKVKVLVNFIEREISTMATIDRWAPLPSDTDKSMKQSEYLAEDCLQIEHA